jgi:hypothetical protein
VAFDFPASPSVGDEYSGYVYTAGSTWDLKPADAVTPPTPIDAYTKSEADDKFVDVIGDTMTGPLVLPSPDPTIPEHAGHKRYIDTTVATMALYQSTWQVAANVPDLNVPPNAPLNGYTWTAVTADRNVPEIAPAGIPGIGGLSISQGDTVKWSTANSAYDLIKLAGGAMTDYVLKTGDTMTGPLVIDGNSGLFVRSAAAGSGSQGLMLTRNADNEMIGSIRMTWSSSLGGEAAMEFWTKNGGYGHLKAFNTVVGSPPGVNFAGAVTVNGKITSNNGIGFGAVVDANADDFAKHIELYSGTNGMGIGSTTGGQFNFVLKNLGHAFNFRIGGATKVQFNQYGIMMQENAGLIDFGSLNTNASPSANNKGIRFFYSASAAYHIGVSSNQMNYVISVGTTRHSFWQGGLERFWIDSTGGHALTMTATGGFKDQSPTRIAKLRAEHPTLCSVIQKTGGDSAPQVDGFDVSDLLMLALAKIKTLEAKLATLEKRK